MDSSKMKIPGPWVNMDPIYGNQTELTAYSCDGKLHELIYKWSLKYGTIFKYYEFDRPQDKLMMHLVVADPQTAKRLLKKHTRKPLDYEQIKLLGKGVLGINDPHKWKHQRNIMKNAFNNHNLKNLFPIILEETNRITDDIHKTNDVYEYICHKTFIIIGYCALGETTDFLLKHASELRKSFYTSIIYDLTQSAVTQEEYNKSIDYMNNFAEQVFTRAKNRKHKKNSILDIIIKSNFTDEERRDQLFTFMFAGHETTANTISWILLELARNPVIQQKLYNEITKRKFENYQDLFKYTYLTKVIHEGMRRWSVVTAGTARILESDEIIMDELVEKGTPVTFTNYSAHLHPQNWKNPFEFNPDRKWDINNFSPFTRPPRDCLGRNLAMIEIRTILIKIIKNYTLSLKTDKNIFVGISYGTMKPLNGVPVVFKQRQITSKL